MDIKNNIQNKDKNKNNNWLKSLIISIFLACIIRWGIFENYKIPSGSMKGTLQVGDTILVSKIHYGPRIPITPVQVPLTHQYIWGTKIKSYSEIIKLPYKRFFGFSKIKRGDNIVFNTTSELDRPIDLRTYFIKRCVALPGDIIEIINSEVYINGIKQQKPKNSYDKYYVTSTKVLTKLFFKANNIENYYNFGDNDYIIYTTTERAKKMQQFSFISSINKEVMEKGISINEFFGYPYKNWNLDYFGPLKIPYKGFQVDIDKEENKIYLDTIKNLEKNNSDVEIIDEDLYIGNKKVSKYIFQQNYYFALGDNRHNSKDSRFIGFIPEDHMVGKAILILYSYNSAKKGSIFKKIRWDRFFRCQL